MAQYNVGRVRGSYIHYITSQTDVPLNALLDDMGINTSTWDVYKFDGNAWIYIDNIHGVAAGFDTPSASATTLAAGSQATVSVSSSGPDTAKKFDFTFGIPGSPTVTASVDNSEANLVGQAHVEVTNTGTTYAPNFEFAFKQLQGVGVQTIAVTYQQGDSATVVPTGTWSDTPVEADPGKYLWTRYIFNKTDGTNATAYSVARQGSPSDIVNVTALEGLGTNWLQYLQQPFLTGNVPIEGNLTVSGDLTAQGDTLLEDTTVNNLVIQGNVTQQGQSFITEAETVEVKDNMITLNNGETGAGVTAGQSGIEIDRGTSNPFFFVFNEDSDRFEVGTSGDLQPVMLRDTEANLTDTNILVWDAANKRAVTSSVNINNITELKLVNGAGIGYLITDVDGSTISRRPIEVTDINGLFTPYFRDGVSAYTKNSGNWHGEFRICSEVDSQSCFFGGVGEGDIVDYAFISAGNNRYDSTEILKVYPDNITFGDKTLAVWGMSTTYDDSFLYNKYLTINSTSYSVIGTNGSEIPRIYTPANSGSDGQILQSDGTNVPKWADKSVTIAQISNLHSGWDTLLAAAPSNQVLRWPKVDEVTGLQDALDAKADSGDLSSYMPKSGGRFTGPISFQSSSLSESTSLTSFLGVSTFASGGQVYYISAADLRTAIGAVSTSAMNTAISNAIDDLGTLTITGAGSGTYNPNNSNTTINIASYSLPTASSSVLGGIKVGSGLTINSSGVLSATGGGQADSVAWENVTDKPSWIGSSKPSYSYSEISGTIPASDLPVATSTALGGVRIGFSESGKNYPVELNDNNQMFVNVPWTDTNTNYYPTDLTWTNGTTAGPVPTIVMNAGGDKTGDAIPAASVNNSGVLTTAAQTIGGAKTFNATMTTQSITPRSDGAYNIGASSNRYANIYADTFTGSLSGNASSATSATTASRLGSSDIGSSTKPIYLDGGSPTASTSTVGGIARPVYLNAGTITALSATEGSSTKPVYLNGGTIAECGSTLSVGITGNAASATSASHADEVDGYHIVVDTALPSSPDSSTIYFITD